MDVTFSNVLEGTRQYFMGVPTQAQVEGSGQPMWFAGAPPADDRNPAPSGASAPSSRPPSAALAPSTTTPTPSTAQPDAPPRPPSEPLEPEPHIIHKATVMREAAEKRREQPEPEDEEPVGALSPPSHIIRKPTPRTLPSPAPAPAAPSPSPVRPPSEAPLPLPPQAPEQQSDHSTQYRPPLHRVQTPTARPTDYYAPGRPPDPYSASRPPEPYVRYHYESNLPDSGRTYAPLVVSQQTAQKRHSPQQTTYARMSSSIPQHASSRLREAATNSPPAQRYAVPSVQPPSQPPHNDRVPPIHHPQTSHRPTPVENRPAQLYAPLPQRRESSSYARVPSHYDRHSIPARKYDHQQSYPGYRPSPVAPQTVQNHRMEPHHHVQYKHPAMESSSSHYTLRQPDRAPQQSQPHSQDTARITHMSRTDVRGSYQYATPSSSSVKHAQSGSAPVIQNSTLSSRNAFYQRTPATPKSGYDYPATNHVLSSPSRPTAMKPSFSSQQARMTVSVTTLVNQMNQTKHKRESPLDLSVKTVKNSADSSTTQDDAVDSASVESKSMPLHPRPSPNSRQLSQPTAGYVAAHKVDFSPDFAQYRERASNHNYSTAAPNNHPPVRYNGAYESPRPVPETFPTESRKQVYTDRKYSVPTGTRTDYVPRIDLTRPVGDEQHAGNRIRDDRHFIIEERKRPIGPIVSNIPEKIVRHETWSSDSRIERMSRSAREQHELMSRPVYSYSSHKRFEAYQNEQKRTHPTIAYHEYHLPSSNRYQQPCEPSTREPTDYHAHYHDRSLSTNSRQVIQKLSGGRDSNSLSMDTNTGIPADKRVLSILRNSLETKQGLMEPTKCSRQIPDLIVIDDVDDSVIEITDLTKDNDIESVPNVDPKYVHTQNSSKLGQHIQMPKAVDSVLRDKDYQTHDYGETKQSISPENDVASRIRTKAELKVLPPSQDNSGRPDMKSDMPPVNDGAKLLPKSMKQHLFNQIREDNLRLESVIKNEKSQETTIPVIKTEPMNIDEIEKDAEVPIKTENILENLEPENANALNTVLENDFDWTNACDNFMEQLKTGCHKKKSRRKRLDTLGNEVDLQKEALKVECPETSLEKSTDKLTSIASTSIFELVTPVVIKQEPPDEDEDNILQSKTTPEKESVPAAKDSSKNKNKNENNKADKKHDSKPKHLKSKVKPEKLTLSSPNLTIKKEIKEKESINKSAIKEESESTDDDEPLIKSKILKEKEQNKLLKYNILRDLSEKSAYVKLECCDVDMNKNRKSLDSAAKEKKDVKDEYKPKRKLTRQIPKTKTTLSVSDNIMDKQTVDSSSDSDDDDALNLASRLRTRKTAKSEDNKVLTSKHPTKSSPIKKLDSNSSTSTSSTPARKPGFGDGSDFHPGWEEELYRYKRSLRMPTRLIAIPRGRSGGPFVRTPGVLFNRGSTSLPDLDPAPLSPAPSSAPSAATDDLYARRQDKLTIDSDLESNSSCSHVNRLHYDSEASTSTVFSSKVKKKGSSIVDVLIQKCGRKDDTKKKKKDDKEEKTPKTIPKTSNTNELLPTPSLGLIKNGNKGNINVKKEKVMEDIFYLGAFRKETVTAFRTAFIKNTDGLIGATEEFSPVVLKSRTRTESRVLKQRATIKEVFGDDRPASAPPSSCRDEELQDIKEKQLNVKKESEPKSKLKPKKVLKDKLNRRSSSIRDGLRSTKSLKRNDAKGRLLRLKKRNNLILSLANKRVKDMTSNKNKMDKSPSPLEDKEKSKEGSSMQPSEGNTKRRLKRLFGRRKFSSGFDYIRKKKKIIRREDTNHKVRRQTVKPSPESANDTKKEIKSWFIKKSLGETHLHRAAKLGYTDCVAYCLEKMEADPSAKDNAGFTPLHVAAAMGHVRIGRLLLQYGANVSAAAQGGIRPLHEASENCHVEMIRLLLAYGADPLLGTYAGQTPEELSEGQAALLLRLHIADIRGLAVEPWIFPPPTEIIDREELGCDPLSSPPPCSPPPPDTTLEVQCTEAPLPPFYSFRTAPGQPSDGLWCLLQDITNMLQIKSKDSLLKQIHCGSGSPRELLREIRTQEFLERAQCHQLLCAGEKVNVRASKVALVRVTDKLRQLLKIDTVLVS